MAHVGAGKAVKWIIGFGFAGWFAIVALAYWLAQQRLDANCGGLPTSCHVMTSGPRDAILLFGLTVALVAAIIVGLTYSTELSLLSWRRGKKWRPAEWGDTEPISLRDQRAH